MRRMLTILAPLTAVGLLTLSGCGGPAAPTGTPVATKAAPKPAAGKTEAAAVAGYAASLKGKVSYNGDAKPAVEMLTPTKDQPNCPKEVKSRGWYVNEGGNGVQYAVVFLKPAAGTKMPKAKAEGTPSVLDMGQPKCQFEPRVLVLQPSQKIRFLNDSEPPIAHDSNISGVTFNYQKTLPPGQKTDPIDPEPSDKNPYGVSCAIHTGTMSGFIWRPTHPWMAVTDKDGNFELKDVPVLEGDKKMELWVWHEMLPKDQNQMMKIADVDAKPNEPATKDFAIPKK